MSDGEKSSPVGITSNFGSAFGTLIGRSFGVEAVTVGAATSFFSESK